MHGCPEGFFLSLCLHHSTAASQGQPDWAGGTEDCPHAGLEVASCCHCEAGVGTCLGGSCSIFWTAGGLSSAAGGSAWALGCCGQMRATEQGARPESWKVPAARAEVAWGMFGRRGSGIAPEFWPSLGWSLQKPGARGRLEAASIAAWPQTGLAREQWANRAMLLQGPSDRSCLA